MSFLCILDVALSIVLLGFNVWNWFLACSGLTTIEFMGQATGYKSNQYDYSFLRIRDNLFKVFGTKSYFALLSPSLRNNAFTGIEWSFQMRDLGFNEYGELLGSNDEEMAIQAEEFESEATEATAQEDDPDGAEEAESTEIAI